MTPDETKKNRQNYLKFAAETYGKLKNHRAYALGDESKRILSALAAAVFARRTMEGRLPEAKPVAQEEFMELVTALARSGCNILQARPSDPKPLPALWTHPLTGQPLPPPKGIGERSLLQKLDPELLKMFNRLEKEPYQTVAKMREDEAKQQAMAAIEYNGDTHEANPFRRGDRTAMAALFKRDAALAAFCEAESKDVELNLFGSQRNLSVRSKLTKDPAAATLVELAEKIDSQWRASDRQQFEEAKAEADEKLKALAAQDEPQPARMAQRARVGVE